MKVAIFKCPPGGMFHFGKIGIDADTSLNATSPFMHSDTLASAIIDTAFRVLEEKKAKEVLDSFKNGNSIVSSMFYCLKTPKGWIYFLPKPVSLEGKNVDNPKQLREIMFLSKNIWERGLLPGEWEDPDKCVILQSKFVIAKEELTHLPGEVVEKIKLFHEFSLPKVSVHKPSRENSIYFQTNILLPKLEMPGIKDISIHFYCFLESEDKEKEVVSLLHLIADEGIGGEHNIGCGRLTGLEIEALEIKPAESGDKFAALSLFSPASQEELDNCKAWKVITRGGRMTAGQGKLKRVKMLSEGSIVDQSVKGNWHQIGNGKRDYVRIGKLLKLPMHKNFCKT